MNDDLHHNEPHLPEELLRQWQQRSPEERAELERVWHLARSARPRAGAEVGDATVRLLAALEAPEEDVRHSHEARDPARAPSQGRAHRPGRARRTFIGGLASVVAVGAVWFALYDQSEISSSGGATPKPQFMLLLHGDPARHEGPEAQAAVVAEYVAWAREMKQANRYIAGDELAASGRFLAHEQGRLVEQTVTPATAPISGYFIITAANEDEAVRIASGCPHLRRGGTVELRPIHR